MYLFVLRHGKAKDGSPDELRELKNRGRKDLATVIEKRVAELKTVNRIQSSALVRAEQTAAIAADLIDFDGTVEENMHLTPWSKPKDFLKTIDESLGNLLIASHQPFVSDLVTLLTNQDVWMPTSSLVCIKADLMTPGMGEIIWQENPED